MGENRLMTNRTSEELKTKAGATFPPKAVVAGHLLRELQDHNDSVAPITIYDAVARRAGFTDEQKSLRDARNRELRYKAEIRLAAELLRKRGHLESTVERQWALTPTGRSNIDIALINGDPAALFPEGKSRYEDHKRHERNPELKNALIALRGTIACEVCGFDFREMYGAAYIECHHVIRVADLERLGRLGTRVDEALLICANCHRMAHHHPLSSEDGTRLRNREELRALLRGKITITS